MYDHFGNDTGIGPFFFAPKQQQKPNAFDGTHQRLHKTQARTIERSSIYSMDSVCLFCVCSLSVWPLRYGNFSGLMPLCAHTKCERISIRPKFRDFPPFPPHSMAGAYFQPALLLKRSLCSFCDSLVCVEFPIKYGESMNGLILIACPLLGGEGGFYIMWALVNINRN